jgi:peptidoglycan L-alanyl-D-glutamate endopeptidase CwlK
MINSRSLDDLNPKVKKLAEQFIKACKDAGIDILIYSTYRDAESQNELYAQGRTKPGRIVTNAKAGFSYHNWRCAFDFVPIVNGKARWDDSAAYAKCGAIAEDLGFEWAGRWSGKLKEVAHLQFTGGLSIFDFQRGKTF